MKAKKLTGQMWLPFIPVASWVLCRTASQEKAAVMDTVPRSVSCFIKIQSNSWTRITGIQIFSYIKPGLRNRTLLARN